MNVPRVGVCVILFREMPEVGTQVLLGKRKGSHGAGTWAFPGGHLEFFEPAIVAAQRELQEETNIVIGLKNLIRGPYVEDVFIKEKKHYITLNFIANVSIDIEPVLMEPDKLERWQWFKKDELPNNLFIPIDNLIRDYNFYGFKKTLTNL